MVSLLVTVGAALFVLKRQSEQQALYDRLVAYWELDPPARGVMLLQLAGMEDVAKAMVAAGMQDIPRKLALHAADIAAHRLIPFLSLTTVNDVTYVMEESKDA